MIGEGEPLLDTAVQGKVDRAKETVQTAAQTVRETTQSLAESLERDRGPGAPLDRLAHWAREAPLHALAVAFLLGAMIGRRRRW
jgi:hypothetical protein